MSCCVWFLKLQTLMERVSKSNRLATSHSVLAELHVCFAWMMTSIRFPSGTRTTRTIHVVLGFSFSTKHTLIILDHLFLVTYQAEMNNFTATLLSSCTSLEWSLKCFQILRRAHRSEFHLTCTAVEIHLKLPALSHGRSWGGSCNMEEVLFLPASDAAQHGTSNVPL